jgi:molecular chaperone DnaK
LIHATKKTLQEAGEEAADEEKSEIETAVAALEEAVRGTDKDDIEVKTQKLTEVSSALAQKMYAQQSAEAQAQAPEEQAEPAEASGEEAVDAEFEEVKDEK